MECGYEPFILIKIIWPGKELAIIILRLLILWSTSPKKEGELCNPIVQNYIHKIYSRLAMAGTSSWDWTHCWRWRRGLRTKWCCRSGRCCTKDPARFSFHKEFSLFLCHFTCCSSEMEGLGNKSQVYYLSRIPKVSVSVWKMILRLFLANPGLMHG